MIELPTASSELPMLSTAFHHLFCKLIHLHALLYALGNGVPYYLQLLHLTCKDLRCHRCLPEVLWIGIPWEQRSATMHKFYLAGRRLEPNRPTGALA